MSKPLRLEPFGLTLPAVLRGLRIRVIADFGWGACEVPMYIVRLDIHDGGAGTHGWQCRFDKPFVFFSDSKTTAGRTPRGNPKTSLKAALAHLARVYSPKPLRERTVETQGKASHTGHVGIRLASRERRRGPNCVIREGYLEAFGPASGKFKRFYIGTNKTGSPERYLKQLQRALEYRRQSRADEARARAQRFERRRLEPGVA